MGLSRSVIAAVVAFLSFALPAGVCLGLAAFTPLSLLHLAATTLAAGACMGLLALVNWWEFTSIHLRWAWIVGFGAAAAHQWVRSALLPWWSSFGAWDLGVVFVGGAAAYAALAALRARHPPVAALQLAFPLKGADYLVTDGGDGARSFLVNYHYGFRRHRTSGVNASMRYAMDVVAIGRGGCESEGYLPRDNAAYHIWRRPLIAPCNGLVVHAVSDVADNRAFAPDRPYGVGNHVVIRVAGDDDAYVVLGHLLHGSVRVAMGEQVRAGDEVGRAGNSGWTERPHLHMQAMRSANGDWWHGEPLPMRFNGRFLARNDVVRTPD